MFQRGLIRQLLITLAAGFAISVIANLMDGSLRGYPFERVAIIILLSMAVCFLAGLPIRINRRTNDWWTHHQLIPIIGVIIGSVSMLLSCTVFEQVDHYYDITMIRSNPFLSIGGWAITIFCLLHWYPTLLRRNLWASQEA
ncbi:MAG TPA: hypothetical protein VHD83_24790 [Puia sp.]|nr:hypothetical protein [Puia sp.]